MKLYHYVHCPFCVRVRMTVGFLDLECESAVLPYHDEETPISLADKKMLPIMEFSEGEAMNESLDIIRRLDKNNELKTKDLSDIVKLDTFNQKLDRLAEPIHNLVMPYWIHTPEFNADSRKYFLKKKEAKRGPFHLLAQKRLEFEQQLEPMITELDWQIAGPYLEGDQLKIWDIMLASHLWGLYCLPEYQFPKVVHQYLQDVAEACQFNYHGDFWVYPLPDSTS